MLMVLAHRLSSLALRCAGLCVRLASEMVAGMVEPAAFPSLVGRLTAVAAAVLADILGTAERAGVVMPARVRLVLPPAAQPVVVVAQAHLNQLPTSVERVAAAWASWVLV